jgi:hypothetical protein
MMYALCLREPEHGLSRPERLATGQLTAAMPVSIEQLAQHCPAMRLFSYGATETASTAITPALWCWTLVALTLRRCLIMDVRAAGLAGESGEGMDKERAMVVPATGTIHKLRRRHFPAATGNQAISAPWIPAGFAHSTAKKDAISRSGYKVFSVGSKLPDRLSRRAGSLP